MNAKRKPDRKPDRQEPAGERAPLPRVYIDDHLMTLKYYVDEHQAHLRILHPELCVRCASKTCLYVCPAGVYQEQASGEVQVAFQSCIECGSCRLLCPDRNVEWKYPRGGFGVAYKFG
jgi:ferredoxin like protein